MNCGALSFLSSIVKITVAFWKVLYTTKQREHCLFLITHINIFVPVKYWNMVCWNIFNPLPKGVCWFAACRFVLLASSRTPTTMMYWPLASLSMLPLTRSWHAFPTTATSNRPKWGKNNQNLSCFNFTFIFKNLTFKLSPTLENFKFPYTGKSSSTFLISKVRKWLT